MIKSYKVEDIGDKACFYCNCAGDLYIPGNSPEFIKDPRKLPDSRLRDLYCNHWTEAGDLSFYVAEFCDRPVMICESSWAYDIFGKYVGVNRDDNPELFDSICDKAIEDVVRGVQGQKVFDGCSIIYGRDDDRVFGVDICFALAVPYSRRYTLKAIAERFQDMTEGIFKHAFIVHEAAELGKTAALSKEKNDVKKIRRCPDCGFDKFETTMHATVKAVVGDAGAEIDGKIDFSSVKSEDWICARCGTVHKEGELWTTKEEAENKFGYQLFEHFDEKGVFSVYEGNKFITKISSSDESMIEKRLANLGYMLMENECGVRHVVPIAYDVECSIVKDGKRRSLVFQGVKDYKSIEFPVIVRSLIKSNGLHLNHEHEFEVVIRYSSSSNVFERKTYKTYFNNGSIVFS